MKELARSAFLAIGGVALTITGVWFAFENVHFLQESERTDGIVTDLETQRARGSTLYRPVVQFHSAERNGPVKFTAKPALWPSPHDKGDRVVVAYKQSDPMDAKIVSFWMLWFLPLLAAFFGAGCFFAGWHNYQHRVR